jgi:hypothetical protein
MPGKLDVSIQKSDKHKRDVGGLVIEDIFDRSFPKKFCLCLISRF